ncbi:MAG TPA: hypothetical protein V6C88_12340, partial [Chroococcidiopsis sp.]
ISWLHDESHEQADVLSAVHSLFQLLEKEKLDILRAPLVIRADIATMEKAICEKRRRHFLDLWTQTDAKEQPDLVRDLQQKFYAEDQRIKDLDRERQVAMTDLAAIPWVGDFYSELEPSS